MNATRLVGFWTDSKALIAVPASWFFPLPHWLLSDLFQSFSTSGWFLIAGVLKSLSLGSSFLLYLYFIPGWPCPFHYLQTLCMTLYFHLQWLPWVSYLYIPLSAWHFHVAMYLLSQCMCKIEFSLQSCSPFLPVSLNGTAIHSVSQAKNLKGNPRVFSCLSSSTSYPSICQPVRFPKPIHFPWFFPVSLSNLTPPTFTYTDLLPLSSSNSHPSIQSPEPPKRFFKKYKPDDLAPLLKVLIVLSLKSK